MAKRKTINIRDIWGCVIKPNWQNGCFVLEFENEKKLVKLHFERYWAGEIANSLWELIDSEESQIKDIKNCLKNE
jgi:hypothetical protein